MYLPQQKELFPIGDIMRLKLIPSGRLGLAND